MKTCIITGISSGIGQAVAIRLSTNKMFNNIALLGRNKETILNTVSLMNKNNLNVKIYEIDLAEPEKIPEIIDSVFETFGTINCLLNIAGYTDPQSLLTTTLENFNLTYRINVFSPFMLIRECTKYMKKNGGKILNIASTAGMSARPGWLSYSSSKAAMISMSQTLTDELAEYGIKIYCISPGRCATNLRKRLAPNEDPLTIMQPDEVAFIICDLIKEDENCLDGQNIVIRKQIRN